MSIEDTPLQGGGQAKYKSLDRFKHYSDSRVKEEQTEENWTEVKTIQNLLHLQGPTLGTKYGPGLVAQQYEHMLR